MEVSNNDILVAVNALSKTVEQYHGDFREHRGSTEVKLKSLEDDAANLAKSIKEDAKSDKFWSNVKTVCVIPVLGLGHQIAAHFGWIK
jgi:hypothetical protein